MTNFNDFIFDGVSASAMDLLLCSFESAGFESRSAGSKKDFITSMAEMGYRWNFHGSKYTAPLEFTIQLCKKDFTRITKEEEAAINRWLIRNDEMKWLQFDHPDFSDIWFKCSGTNCELLTIGHVYGMEISFLCDSPFGYSSIRNTQLNVRGTLQVSVVNESQEIGSIYPNLDIHILGSGELSILNQLENRTLKLRNCTAGEKIFIDGILKTIVTSDKTHKIYNDFNWNHFRLIRNTQTINPITITGNADITLSYRAIKKVGV